MSQKIYTVEANQIIAHDLDDVRYNINMANGCPMPSGVAPKYEIREQDEFRVMQAGENGYADHQYSAHDNERDAQDDMNDVMADEPERRAWVDSVTVFVVGYNAFGKFHEFDRFESEEEATEKLNACVDELISKDESCAYYWSREQAVEFVK